MKDAQDTWVLVTENGWPHANYNFRSLAARECERLSVPLSEVDAKLGKHHYTVVPYVPQAKLAALRAEVARHAKLCWDQGNIKGSDALTDCLSEIDLQLPHRDPELEAAREELRVLQAQLDHERSQLAELHGYVRDMCVHLGADESEVPCDAWTLRDLLIVMKRVADSPVGPVSDRGEDTVCAGCGVETYMGHTHLECYKNGLLHGHLDGHIDAAASLSRALGYEYGGELFEQVLAKIPVRL